MKHKIIGLSLLCMFSFNAIAQATDDNEINIDQTGDTLTLVGSDSVTLKYLSSVLETSNL